MNALLCCFFKSFIDVVRNEKKSLPSPRRLIFVNFKVGEMTMKVSLMAGSMHAMFKEEQELFGNISFQP